MGRAVVQDDAGASTRLEQLTSVEQKQMTLGPSITTMTFMRGSDPSGHLGRRLALVVEANPWLAGKLVKVRSKLCLRFEQENAKADQLFHSGVGSGGLKLRRRWPQVHSQADFKSLCKEIGGSAAEVPPGNKCIGNSEPLLSLSVIPDCRRPDDTFCIVFSLSHVIADGYTYYQLLSMLDENKPITTLSPIRKHGIVEQGKLAMGLKEAAFAHSGSVIWNVVTSMLCGKRAWVENYLLDMSKISSLKESAAGKKEGVDFVSTNDVLCSRFGTAIGCRALLMPINFREKLADFNANDAGNYEGSLVFGPEDFQEPHLIRQTLKSGPPVYSRQSTAPLPGYCESMRCRLGMVTNWAFPHFSQLVIPGCQQLIHMPHSDPSMIPFDVAVIYKAHADKLGFACFVRSVTEDEIANECPIQRVIPCAEQS